MSKVNIHTALSAIANPWQPHRIASVNDYEVKAVKLLGDFVWHKHDDTDELFFIVKGNLTIEFRDGPVHLEAGDVYVVPRGVEHRPRAAEEVQALLFEPGGVVNTGDAPEGELTAKARVFEPSA
jgi:mannose-6-phosphate isomerase-like protein (cupin superfamily)